jgi:hypothetical protein
MRSDRKVLELIFYMPTFSSSLITGIKSKAKCNFVWYHISLHSTDIYLNKSCIFFEDILSSKISDLYILSGVNAAPISEVHRDTILVLLLDDLSYHSTCHGFECTEGENV